MRDLLCVLCLSGHRAKWRRGTRVPLSGVYPSHQERVRLTRSPSTPLVPSCTPQLLTLCACGTSASKLLQHRWDFLSNEPSLIFACVIHLFLRFVSTGKLTGHSGPVLCLTVERLGQGQDMVLTGSKDHHVKVGSCAQKNAQMLITVLTCHGCMCWLFQMFEVAEGAQGSITSSHTFEPAHQDSVESLTVHRDIFYSSSRDYYIKKWDLASRKLLQVR